MTATALEVGALLGEDGLDVDVVSPTWVVPTPSALVDMCADREVVVTIEDGIVSGGVGALLAETAADAGHRARVRQFGIPAAFLDHATRDQIVETSHLRPAHIASAVLADLAAQRSGEADRTARL